MPGSSPAMTIVIRASARPHPLGLLRMGAIVGDFLRRQHEADEDAILVALKRIADGNILLQLLDP